MNIPYIEFLFGPMRSELPDYEELDKYIDFILPKIIPYSEDLYEEEYYTEKPWREVNDDDALLDVILHILNPHGINVKNDGKGAEYIFSINGNVEKGNWARLEKHSSNMITLRTATNYSLYEKAFINGDFFILKKHGDRWREGNNKYLVMGREARIKNLEWREVVEVLYDIYRYRIRFIIFVMIAAILVFVILVLSIF